MKRLPKLSRTAGATFVIALSACGGGDSPTPVPPAPGIKGDYQFAASQIWPGANPMLCDRAGVWSFDGASMLATTGTNRCSNGLTVTENTFGTPRTYSVNADGSFSVSDPAAAEYRMSGESVLGGSALLAVRYAPGAVDLTQAVGMKRVSTGSAPAYSNASLNGSYLVVVTEVFSDGVNMQYCNASGTLSFDGAGAVTVAGTNRCTADGTTIDTGSKTETTSYAVAADGSFTLGATKPLHGRIVLDGNSLLMDGASQGSSPADYLQHGIAMKRVSAGTPPSYGNASLSGDYLVLVSVAYPAEPGVLTGCVQTGTANFDAAGKLSLAKVSDRCSDGTQLSVQSLSGTDSYAVAADGSFTIGNVAGEQVHGQIALDGRAALVDGTLQSSGLLFYGVAMKR